MTAAKKLPDTTSTVHLDLDAIERPAEERREPYAFNLKGRVITLNDPQDMDWREVVLLDNPVKLFRLCLNEEDRVFFFEQELDSWRLGELVKSFNAHYGVEEQIRKARQQQELANL